MLVGYARVSTKDQQTELQEQALKDLGAEKVFTDQASGASATRPGLRAMLDFVREGDTILVTKLDRLARSAVDAHTLAAEIQKRGANLRIEDIGVDTAKPVGKLVFGILAAVAEMERDRIRERQREGIDKAKADGKHLGRPRKIDTAQVHALTAKGKTPTEIARTLNCSRMSVYRALGKA